MDRDKTVECTMPAFPLPGQPSHRTSPPDWFASPSGRVLLASQTDALVRALNTRPGPPWLWLSPHGDAPPDTVHGRGLHLIRSSAGRWQGDAVCTLPLPLPSEVFGTIVAQHVLYLNASGTDAELSELTRVLAPGGILWLFALNPLSPYRWHWRGSGLSAAEPARWRQRLQQAGLSAQTVSQGLGPYWRQVVDSSRQNSAGLRAAYLLRAEKRQYPLTPIRQRRFRVLPQGAPAT